jgi:hypothetical protein
MKMNIFRIHDDEATKRSIDPGFLEMENTGNARADWCEYWPIRHYFLNNVINEDELYGFFSPGFFEKTSLTSAQIGEFINNNPDRDVYTFSPSIQDAACYLNVFEQGNFFHPGLVGVANAFLSLIQLPVDLDVLVMDFRTMVYGNDIVAKPVFWRTWFELTEKIFGLAEDEQNAFSEKLNSLSIDGTPVGMKVLLVERIASLVLALDKTLKIANFDVSKMPCSNQAYSPFLHVMPSLDGLKSAYLRTQDRSYLEGFFNSRKKILQLCEARYQDHEQELFVYEYAAPKTDVIYGCMTHVPLTVDFPAFITPIYSGAGQKEGTLNLRDLAPEWEPYHPLLGGTAGAFAFKNYVLKYHPDAKRIGICQYRKFVSLQSIGGTPAANYRMMDVVPKAQLDAQKLAAAIWPGQDDFLIGKVYQFPSDSESYFEQYTQAHHAEDLLRFTSEAVELGVLDKDEILPFFNEDVFFPGGVEMGVYPAGFWIKAITAIEDVVRACVQRYPATLREGYQIRVWAFCAERLGSYLLVKQLRAVYRDIDWQARFIGQLNVISDEEQGVYVPGK